MASHHQVAIAKASFAAALLRPDPTSLARDEISVFHTLLDRTLTQCSPINVQNCKRWLLQNAIRSNTRITAFGKYLTSLSSSFTDAPQDKGSGTAGVRPVTSPSSKRRRLHILYLLNDLLYHTRYHSSPSASIAPQLQPHLVGLFGSAAAFAKCPKHQNKLLDLLQIWESKEYYSRDYIDKLRESIKNAQDALSAPFADSIDSKSISDGVDGSQKPAPTRATPFVMPAFHGDPSTPYYDLPAGNMMPHIIPGSSTPINALQVKPLQFVAGPADAHLITVVKEFLEDAERIFDPAKHADQITDWEINEMGEQARKEADPDGEGYYGWSRAFCEKMKSRKAGKAGTSDVARGRNRGDSTASSRGSPQKRRRYSYSDDSRSSSRSQSRSGSGYRDRSRSRSRSRRNYTSSKDRRSYSPSRSPSGSRSRSRHEQRYLRDHQPVDTPPPPPPPSSLPAYPPHPPPFPFYPPGGQHPPFPPPPPPPKRAPGFSGGPWPPPPPPPPTMSENIHHPLPPSATAPGPPPNRTWNQPPGYGQSPPAPGPQMMGQAAYIPPLQQGQQGWSSQQQQQQYQQDGWSRNSNQGRGR